MTTAEERRVYREKLMSIGYLSQGQSRAKKVTEKVIDGIKTKATTDEAGNTVTEWDTKDNRVDVEVHPTTINLTSMVKKG